MSQAHVDLMNAALTADTASRSACKALDRVYHVAYKLARDGGTVWWTMSFDPACGVRFSLEAPPAQDTLFLVGEFGAVIEATRRTKAGEFTPPPVQAEGDVSIYGRIMTAFNAAQAAATIDTEFPAA